MILPASTLVTRTRWIHSNLLLNLSICRDLSRQYKLVRNSVVFLPTFSLSPCLFQLNLFKTFRVLLILPIFVLISMRSCLNTVGPVNPVPPVSVVSPVSTVSHVSLAHPPASGACSGRKKSRARIYLFSSMLTLSFTSKAFSSFFSFD